MVAGDPWLYTVARFALVPLAHLYGRLEVRGLERVPQRGAGLIMANHPSDLDPLLVSLPVRRTVHFLASADHYERPFVGWCMRRLATVSVDRYGQASEALEKAVELLQAGELVAVFPEPNERQREIVDKSTKTQLPPLGLDALSQLAESCRVPLINAMIEGTAELQWGRWRHELPSGWRRRPAVRLTFTARPSSL